MRQKLVSRTVRRPSPTPAVMVRLRSTNTKKIQFTQRLPLGSELHMGKERCCLRGLDHLHGPTSHSICGNLMIYKPSLTNDRLMFEHDESLRADLRAGSLGQVVVREKSWEKSDNWIRGKAGKRTDVSPISYWSHIPAPSRVNELELDFTIESLLKQFSSR
ncbi:unnamed protein product [Dovyalis caffra]|uniref:Uncharacterized protein n=1 Tax=Dovyalis caffra TaxID=77055 RepID=A0AAV1QV31_9ROSI|nr:unnamed protein product [Dovyalis caffra]